MNIEFLKKLFAPNTRVRLIHMSCEEERPIPEGTLGKVISVDDIGTIHVIWDNGRILGVVPDEDDIEVLSKGINEQN